MATIHIDETRPLGTIAPEIYGHFSEHLAAQKIGCAPALQTRERNLA